MNWFVMLASEGVDEWGWERGDGLLIGFDVEDVVGDKGDGNGVDGDGLFLILKWDIGMLKNLILLWGGCWWLVILHICQDKLIFFELSEDVVITNHSLFLFMTVEPLWYRPRLLLFPFVL